ncbi:Predicted oxidoreductase [Rhizobium mongolense subsp. loessense]|uniref:Predicted oxidoreductase n=1 Tax=Rhizobium mongolense subsp. loessense TaxID=158890 RepID=A0A1G4UED6_9HYPH|nr:aldo/keto reductase [Rhizobium mongolense]SCW91119.1 Predicted oxidoreductase [Rhizobium mongolense subsp. loessense]
MSKQRVGRSNLFVEPLGLGGNVFGWTIDEQTSFRVLDAFVAAGFNLIDTADVYSNWAPGNPGGVSETIIGNWMRSRGNRDAIVLTTKVGHKSDPDQRGQSRDYITNAVEASLRRLGTDYIDLYLAHCEDSETHLEETLDTYSGLVRAGKVRSIGASQHSQQTLSRAQQLSADQGWARFENVQSHYNLYDRKDHENELAPFCLANDVGVTSYFSLARGFLSGKYRSRSDFRKSPTRGFFMKYYLNDRGLRILEALDDIAVSRQLAPASVAIAWLITKPGIVAPIASATNLDQLDEIINGARLSLHADELARLEVASTY